MDIKKLPLKCQKCKSTLWEHGPNFSVERDNNTISNIPIQTTTIKEAKTWNWKGNSLSEIGKYDEAKICFETANKIRGGEYYSWRSGLPRTEYRRKKYRKRLELKEERRTETSAPEYRSRRKERENTPEHKLKQKEYNNRPEVKARRQSKQKEYDARRKEKKKEYYSRPEVIARQKEYYSRPENKAKIKEYNSRPEVIAKQKEYLKEYNSRPENKAKAKQLLKKRSEKT